MASACRAEVRTDTGYSAAVGLQRPVEGCVQILLLQRADSETCQEQWLSPAPAAIVAGLPRELVVWIGIDKLERRRNAESVDESGSGERLHISEDAGKMGQKAGYGGAPRVDVVVGHHVGNVAEQGI